MDKIVNIAGYRFVRLDALDRRRDELKTLCKSLDIKGTILLSAEGINLFLAGHRIAIDQFLEQLRAMPGLAEFAVKESISDRQPFNRLLVRLKKEIIAFGVEGIDPSRHTSPKLSAARLRQWLDEQRPLTLLDVRNNYEVELGTFSNAVAANIDSFRDFPSAVARLPESAKTRPVVMFCTGGIRCEKAGPYMEQAGFQNIFQLDGGILQYFEDCGSAHYEGDCFVFDQRVAVDPELSETDVEVCFACQHVLQPEDRQSDRYVAGKSCPWCYHSVDELQQASRARRHAAIRRVTRPLPGSVPYKNYRPMNVPRRFDQASLLDFLAGFHPHIERQTWLDKIQQGHLFLGGQPLAADQPVRGGQRILHLLPGTVEPDVSTHIEIIHEDDEIVIVNKPAPLPMHPSGRYNRNTLKWILDQVYETPLRVVHRLDANTTGLVVFTKTRKIAARLQPQFEQHRVEKRYLVRVVGCPPDDHFNVNQPISDQPVRAGGRQITADGKHAVTRFQVLQRFPDGQSLVHAFPETGRTNQIRVHLWHLGYPVAGDPTYRPAGQIANHQTLAVTDPPMCLHAEQLRFNHPATDQRFEISCTAPAWGSQRLA